MRLIFIFNEGKFGRGYKKYTISTSKREQSFYDFQLLDLKRTCFKQLIPINLSSMINFSTQQKTTILQRTKVKVSTRLCFTLTQDQNHQNHAAKKMWRH